MLNTDKEIPKHYKIKISEGFDDVLVKIKEIVSDYFNVDYKFYAIKTRKREVIEIKHWSMFYIYTHYNMSEYEVAERFGFINHSTFASAYRKIKGWLSTNSTIEKQYWFDICLLIGSNSFINDYNEKNASRKTLMQDSKVIISVKKFDILLENPEKGIIFVGHSDEEVEQFRKDMGLSIKNLFSYNNDNLSLNFTSSQEKRNRTSINLKLKQKQ